jgi:putative salt-induced outer membrane protein YdiY
VKRDCFIAALAVTACTTHLYADTVELVTGELLHGTVTEQTDASVAISHPILGEMTIPMEQVQGVLVTSEEGAAESPPPPPVPVNLKQNMSNKLLPGWDKYFELGFTGSDGNTQTSTVSVGFAALRENDHERTKLDLSHFRYEDDGARTRNEAAAELVHDWLMPGSPWFKFMALKLDYDEFKDWETRASGFVGVGKQIHESDSHSVIGRAGQGASYEFGTVNELVPEALLGLEWIYTINARQTLSSYVTLYPSFDDFGESRTVSGAAWTIAIDEADGISLKLGIDNEYESRTEGSSKHNDVKYYGALVFDF